MRRPTLAALAVLLLATPAAAQQASDGLSGTRVRVTAPNFIPTPVTGTVSSYTQQGIVVVDELTGDTITLPLRSVSRLDEFAGGSAASTAWYRGRIGAFIGAGLGLIAGPVLSKVTGGDMVENTLLGGAVGMTAGFAVGAITGAAVPRERWQWTMQPWGYDPSLRPAPQIPPPPAVQAPAPEQPAMPAQPPAQPQPQTPPPAPPPVQP